MTDSTDKKTIEINRRDAAKLLAALTGATALAMANWKKPDVRVGTLPAYAQGSLIGAAGAD